jgi:DNA polymerase III epsilon subunit-like protein
MIPETYVAIDLETSGLPEEDKKGNKNFSKVCILRIGAYCRHTDQRLDLIVKPEDGFALNPQALAINGITKEQLDAGLSINAALARLCEFLRGFGCVVGQNIVAFDLPLLRVWASRLGIADFDQVAFDTKALWVAFDCGLRQQFHETIDEFMLRASLWRSDAKSSLDHLARIFLGSGAVRTGAHSAVDDAFLSAQVFEAMRERGILQKVLGGK